jgi:hypothetical protein
LGIEVEGNAFHIPLRTVETGGSPGDATPAHKDTRQRRDYTHCGG